MYSFLSNIYPKKFKNMYYELLDYFDIKVRKEFILGTVMFFSIGLGLSIAFQFSTQFLGGLPPILSLLIFFLGFFILIQVLFYSIVSMVATNRAKYIESVLPDSLELISANLRAGMTIDRAMMAANRKEFGHLNILLTNVSREVSTGKEISEALMNMTRKVKSEKFARTIELIIMAIRSGGELSRLLGQVADNLVHQRIIEEKIKAGVTTYLIFIGAAVVFAAPFLYGLSSVFVKIIIGSFGNVNMPANSQAAMPFSISISPEMAIFLPPFVKFYAALSLATLGIMSSFLLGQIKAGKARFGLTYIPFIVGFSMGTYFIISSGAAYLFGSIM